MNITEDEAKERWCPFSRAQGQGVELSHNRPDSSYNCIASQCMAWQQEMRVKGYDLADEPTGRGYCGLAGKPEA